MQFRSERIHEAGRLDADVVCIPCWNVERGEISYKEVLELLLAELKGHLVPRDRIFWLVQRGRDRARAKMRTIIEP